MSRKTYPKYKPSGVEWLGYVPEHWGAKRAKFVAKAIMGQSPSSDAYTFNESSEPFLQGNAEFGTQYPSPKYYCDEAMKQAPEGSILISIRAPVGALNIADRAYGIGRGLCAIVPDGISITQRFAWYLLTVTRNELWSIATGSTYEAVSAVEVASMMLLVPPYSEQQAIASFLDHETQRIDSLIQKKQRQIELLKEKRSALISHAVTKGLDPNVPMKDSGIEWVGQIPEHWGEAVQVKRNFDIRLGKMLQNSPESQDDTLVPYLKALHVLWGSVIVDDLPEMWASQSEIRQYGVEDGDLLVCEGGEAGRSGIVSSLPDNCIIQNALHRLRTRGSGHVDFLMYVLHAIHNSGWFDVLCSKATIAHLTGEKLASLRVPMPKIHEQQNIVAFIKHETAQIDSLIRRVKESVETLREYRVALISAAVTGKIDVREKVQT